MYLYVLNLYACILLLLQMLLVQAPLSLLQLGMELGMFVCMHLFVSNCDDMKTKSVLVKKQKTKGPKSVKGAKESREEFQMRRLSICSASSIPVAEMWL